MLGNFQCWGVLLIEVIVGQRPALLAVDVGGGIGMFFRHLMFLFSPLFLEGMVRYRLKSENCLKVP